MELAARRRARSHLLDFTLYTYPQYRAERVHRLIADTVMRVVDGEISRLMIFAPPQHGKSEKVSVRLPAFWLGRRPDDPIILTSYAAGLAESKSRQARAVVDSVEYRNVFPGVRLDTSSRAVDHWQLAGHRGGLLAAGVGGPITGHGAMLGIIDDPVENWEQAQSQTYRERAWEWFRTTFRTRIWEGGAIILIQTRWHLDDLAGRLLREQPGEWTVLRLPALSEGEGDPLGRPAGEPLAPLRFSRFELERIKRDVGTMAWAAEYQGTPLPQEGALIEIGQIRQEDAAPGPEAFERIVRYWDLASGVKTTNDFTAGAKLGRTHDGHLWLLHVKRGRWKWPDARLEIRDTALNDGPAVVQGIEHVGFQQASYDDLVRMNELAGVRFVKVAPDGDKVARAGAWGGRVKDGLFHAVRGEWLPDFLDEAAAFPVGRHDDQVDAVSGANQMLRAKPTPLRPIVVETHQFGRPEGPTPEAVERLERALAPGAAVDDEDAERDPEWFPRTG